MKDIAFETPRRTDLSCLQRIGLAGKVTTISEAEWKRLKPLNVIGHFGFGKRKAF